MSSLEACLNSTSSIVRFLSLQKIWVARVYYEKQSRALFFQELLQFRDA